MKAPVCSRSSSARQRHDDADDFDDDDWFARFIVTGAGDGAPLRDDKNTAVGFACASSPREASYVGQIRLTRYARSPPSSRRCRQMARWPRHAYWLQPHAQLLR